MKTPKTNLPSSRAAWDGYDMEGSRVRKRIANAQPLSNPETIWRYQLDNHLGTSSIETEEQANLISYEEYHPFGSSAYRAKNAQTEAPPKRYRYNGKERDEESGLYYYGARYYAGWLCRFVSVDPLEQEAPNWTPYRYGFDSPINFIDKCGCFENPIYDKSANFLGTDDRGLKGEAIVMNKIDFTQGMSHEDALSKGSLRSNLAMVYSQSFFDKLDKHHSNLANRPDWHGFLTISDGIAWAKEHPYAVDNVSPDNTIYLDASKLNFGSLQPSNLTVGEQKLINLYDYTDWISMSSRHTVYALGNTNIELIDSSSGTVRLFSDFYDWDYHQDDYTHSFINPPSGERDRLVWGERILKGLDDSHGFKVYIYGTGTLNKYTHTYIESNPGILNSWEFKY